MQELNPHVKRLTTPNDDPDFNLYVPQGLADKLVQEIAAIPEGMRVNWRKHRVDEGETLSQIAQRYRTTSSAIAQVNSLSEDARLQLGDKLIIPVTPGQGGRGPAGDQRFSYPLHCAARRHGSQHRPGLQCHGVADQENGTA